MRLEARTREVGCSKTVLTHGLVGDTSVGVDLLQHLVDVRRVRLGLERKRRS